VPRPHRRRFQFSKDTRRTGGLLIKVRGFRVLHQRCAHGRMAVGKARGLRQTRDDEGASTRDKRCSRFLLQRGLLFQVVFLHTAPGRDPNGFKCASGTRRLPAIELEEEKIPK